MLVFANRSNFLNTLQVGDQIFVNAYLIAVKVFANAGQGKTAAYAAEFMGVEAVHRALARQSLGLLGERPGVYEVQPARDCAGRSEPGSEGVHPQTSRRRSRSCSPPGSTSGPRVRSRAASTTSIRFSSRPRPTPGSTPTTLTPAKHGASPARRASTAPARPGGVDIAR